jgi:hypothetical protein
LIVGKILGGGDERKKADETDKQRSARPYIQNDQERGDYSKPANGYQTTVGCAEPKQRGREPKFHGWEGGGNGFQIVGGGEDSVGANKPSNLEQQRIESGEVNQTQAAKENPPGPKMAGVFLADRLRTQEPLERGGEV